MMGLWYSLQPRAVDHWMPHKLARTGGCHPCHRLLPWQLERKLGRLFSDSAHVSNRSKGFANQGLTRAQNTIFGPIEVGANRQRYWDNSEAELTFQFSKCLTTIRTVVLDAWPRHRLKLGLIAGGQLSPEWSRFWPAPAVTSRTEVRSVQPPYPEPWY